MDKLDRKTLILSGISIVLFVSFITAIIGIIRINKDFTNTISSYSSKISALEAEIDSLYDTIEIKLSESANSIADISFSFGEFDVKTAKANVKINVVPKQVKQDTSVEIEFYKKIIPLEKSGNVYSGIIQVPVFSTPGQNDIILSITSDKIAKSQYVKNLGDSIQWKYLPQTIAEITNLKTENTDDIYTVSGNLIVDVKLAENYPDGNFSSFSIVTLVNGKEFSRENKSNLVNPYGVPAEISKSCKLSKGDELLIVLEAVDSFGYIHKTVLHSFLNLENSECVVTLPIEGIYSSDGTLLFSNESLCR